MSVTAAIRRMIAAGLTVEQALLAAEACEAEIVPASRRTARQDRNARYYDRTKRLKASEQDVSDHSDDGVPLNDGTVLTTNLEFNLNPLPPKAPLSEKLFWPRDAFGQFWALYPNRVKKLAAEKVFNRLRKGGKVSFEQIMAGLRAYLATNPNPDFIPHPTSWLNAGQWADEPMRPLAVVETTTGALATGGFYAKQDTPQFDAWRDHTLRVRGRPPPTDSKGGWLFPSEWPPERLQAAE